MRRSSTLRRVVLGVAVATSAWLGVLVTAEPSHAHFQKRLVASADRGMPATLTETLTSAHFVVHYSVAGDEHATTRQAAQLVIERAEKAWSVGVDQWGYPRPLDDGDGRVDIYIHALHKPNVAGWARPEKFVGRGATGLIAIDVAAVKQDDVVAHELFHLVQFTFTPYMSSILLEATARWSTQRMGFGAELWWAQYMDSSFDCDCMGYERWPFFEFLADRYGPSFIRSLFEVARDQRLRDTHVVLSAALAARGTTLEREYEAFALASFHSGHRSGHLARFGGQTHSVLTSAPLTTTTTLDHLSTRWLDVRTASLSPCRLTTLRATVTLPAGIAAVPHFSPATTNGLPVPFVVAGGVATAAIPWNTCPSGLVAGRRMMLTNPSVTVDGALFQISIEIVPGLAPTPVPTGTIATTAPPVVTTPTATPVVTTPTAAALPAAHPDSAPTIAVIGRSAAARPGGAAKVTVRANGAGMLQVSCASLRHEGIVMIVAGANNFSVPIVAGTRKGSHICTLRSLSTAGSAGADLIRVVLTVRAAKTSRR